ncbi:MAG: ATP-binding protein [Chloroflexota bacterium]
MSDGLFLLSNRPQAGLSIILRTLDEVAASDQPWQPLEQRQALYRSAYALLEAPSITELTLLRPQLLEVLVQMDRHNEWSPVLDSLLPVLANLRDSERVESVDDRLVYLNQAAVRLRELQEQLPAFSHDVERTLVRLIARRWSALISAEIEEQRGRAELQIALKTKRIVPNGRTYVAMEIRNNGRAPAENIIAMLETGPAYHVFTPPQTIAFLPSGRTRQVRFLVEPKVEDRFRVALSMTYDDRNRTAKTQAFGDMVHLLPPVREFTPITNPYVPGTPLRRNSPLFFGREELFEFIREATMATAGRNVLMLVGQRRTGKTSALLRIQEYLPPHLIPVYIDCQALGVAPGMPALLEELAWQIADTLSERDIICEMPDHQAWEAEPTRLFQRNFLPHVRSLLPDEAMLLLVFDEFEAFESMVDDGLLPRTLFTYMRHLMQHSVGLSFVFVGTRRLEEMSSDYWSVLFNIALYRKIDFLSEQAATRLITEPVAPFLVYDDLAIDKILRVTAGHPYFLQLVCYTLVKRANQERNGYITISDVNDALDEMLRLGEVHFAYLWQRSSYVERALLTAAAHLADRNEPLYAEEFSEYLQSYGIELDPAEVTTGLNSLVERDIMREVNEEGTTVYDLRIGLVGLWVAQNKSLSRLLAQTEI